MERRKRFSMPDRFTLAVRLFAAAALASGLAACGGGGESIPVATTSATGSSSTPPPPPTSTPVPATTPVAVRVIDGAIQNAKVCLDANGNGSCDTGEPTAFTDASGNATLQVPNESVGRYPVVAAIGTDAIDADSGPVKQGYTLAAPADQTAVVSPLTTLAQALVQSQGLSSSDAAKQVQAASGLTVSVYADYVQARATDPNSANAGLVAAIVASTLQQQTQQLQSLVGTNDRSGNPITQADINLVINTAVVAQLATASVAATSAATQSACAAGPAPLRALRKLPLPATS